MQVSRAGLTAGLIVFGSTIGCRTSEGQAAAALNGSYRCFTTSMQQVGATPNARDRNEREKRGMHELERGERAVPIAPEQQVMVMPAFFGNVEMDGRGAYRLTRTGHSGRYSVNRSTGAVTFTGDLKVMDLRRKTGRDGFFLVYQDLAFECGNTSSSASAGAASGSPAGSAATATTPPTAAQSPQAADYTGRFGGRFYCGGTPSTFQLELQATPAGDLAGVYSSGGDAGKPVESYAVSGRWSGADFHLEPGRWIQQPSGAYLVGFAGRVDGSNLTGKMQHPNCTDFIVWRR
jgi:hypothetical protein